MKKDLNIEALAVEEANNFFIPVIKEKVKEIEDDLRRLNALISEEGVNFENHETHK